MKVIKVVEYSTIHQICFETNVAQAEKALATPIFQSADDRLYANTCDPAVPSKPPILWIDGLNNYPTPGHGHTELWPCQ